MVNESDDKYDTQEDGEYHFSDDQINYEVEPELPKSSAQGVTTMSSKKDLIQKFSQHRKALIVTVVLVALVFIIYKMLMPASTSSAPPTDFSQSVPVKNQAPIPVTAPAARPVQPVQTTQTVQTVTSTSAETPPLQTAVVAPLPMHQPQQMVESAPSQPSAALPEQGQPSAAAPLPMPGAMPGNIPAPPTAAGAQGTMPAPVPEQSQKSIMDRLAILEEQNAKMASLLQTQYAQKVVEYEVQNNATQEKVKVLNKRLANMEATLNQMARLLQGGARPMSSMPPPPLAKPAEPKIIFTVQAIIPGRAWLKSDSGETVTVAEGDVLKDYGRITKIDPYDGVVDIDTGTKIITLSYGMTGDQ